MKQLYFIISLLFSLCLQAQIGIGTTTPTGALDILSTNSGVVIPRMALSSRLVAAPVTNPQGGALTNGTMIWNTATAGTSPNNVVPGFYYWNSGAWNAIGGIPTRDWAIGGNSITDPTTEFIGTTTNQDFRVRTNNSERFTFTNNGRLRSSDNGLVNLPTYSWVGDENTGIWRPAQDFLAFTTNGVDRLRIPNSNQIHAMSLGTSALPFYSFSSDVNTGIYSAGADILNIATGGLERMRVLANGQVSVNMPVPFAGDQFSVVSTGSAINGYGNQIGLYGQSTTAGGLGVSGVTNRADGTGIAGENLSVLGTGIVGAGQNENLTILNNGSGAAFTGTSTGIYSFFTSPGDGEGLLIQDDFLAQWNVGGWDTAAGGYFKIVGTGSVSTVVKDLNNQNVVMFCPESPENLFTDYGSGKLVNGKAKINLDPIFSKNIKVNDEFPMKVFIQLEGDCKGVYVTNKSAESFEVIELQTGTSNVSFSYSITANRADEVFTSATTGEVRKATYDKRFPPAPTFRESKKIENLNAKKLH